VNVINFFRLGGLFVLASFFGRALWYRLELPYHNPLGVVGYLASLEINPWNDVLRFVALLLMPILFFCVVWRLKSEYLGLNAGVALDEGGARKEKAPGFLCRKRDAIVQPGLLVLWLFVFFAALAIPTHFSYQPYVDTFHEGEALGTAQSVSKDAKPYRDVIFIHGAYQDPLRAKLAFQLFGRSIGAVRALESIHKICAFILLAALLWVLFAGQFALVFMALGALILLHMLPRSGLAPYLWIPPRDMLVFAWLLAVFRVTQCLKGELKSPPVISAFGVGLITIGAFAYSVDRAFQISAALLVLLGMGLFFGLYRKIHLRMLLLPLLGGAAAGLGILSTCIGGEFSAFVDYVFLKLPLTKDFLDGLPYPIHDQTHFVIALMVSFNVYILFYRFACICSRNVQPWRANARIFLQNNGVEMALCLVSLSMFRTALVTSNWEHIVYSLAPTYVLALKLLGDALAGFFSEKLKQLMPRPALPVVLLICSGFYFLAPIPQSATWIRNFPVEIPDSAFLEPKDQALLSFFGNKNLQDGDFFSLTPEAFWYYLLDVASPTRFPINWFALLPEYQQEMVDDLEKNQVKWVLYKNKHWSNRIDKIGHEKRLPQVFSYIHAHYEPFTKIFDHQIWRRRHETVILEQQNQQN